MFDFAIELKSSERVSRLGIGSSKGNMQWRKRLMINRSVI